MMVIICITPLLAPGHARLLVSAYILLVAKSCFYD